ncbi:amidase family protein [Microbacterium sp. 179-I 3D3 NHS]|uniref:amidase family protein n=1 Tax=Microbacterium sp. 179-I 3D3 NHS TaxID=3142382 RepID=UPI0039A0FB9B
MSISAPAIGLDTGIWTELADAAALARDSTHSPVAFPLAVKANIGVRGFARSAGCRLLDTGPEEADAPVVAAFRAAGAVVVGTTNMHELALGVTSDNASYGPVLLPLDGAFAAGGSSGGSAAAVAAGAVPFALGTDTGGSVSIPASHCGVVGFRPSTGRWPTAGLVGLSWTRDTPGVFTRDVGDAIRADSWVTGSVAGVVRARPRLGVPRELVADLDPRTAHAFASGLAGLAGIVELVEVSLAPILRRTRAAEPAIVGWESVRELGLAAARALGLAPDRALEALSRGVESTDVAAYLAAAIARPVSADQYAAAQSDTVAARGLADALFAAHDLDALVFPTTPAPAPRVDGRAEGEHLGRATSLFDLYTRNTGQGTVLGCPMVTVPLPVDEGALPIGLTLQGRRHDDARVLALAEVVSRRLAPASTPTS